jgi:hypothetical protein
MNVHKRYIYIFEVLKLCWHKTQTQWFLDQRKKFTKKKRKVKKTKQFVHVELEKTFEFFLIHCFKN